MIDSYSFGKIVVDGQIYTSDIILYPNKIDDKWWRKSGHLLQKEDLKDIIQSNPEILIVGTGAYGLMKVPIETKNFIESKRITLIAEKTGEAYKTYNKIKNQKKIIAAFHLTC
jgi:hypothetical protein